MCGKFLVDVYMFPKIFWKLLLSQLPCRLLNRKDDLLSYWYNLNSCVHQICLMHGKYLVQFYEICRISCPCYNKLPLSIWSSLRWIYYVMRFYYMQCKALQYITSALRSVRHLLIGYIYFFSWVHSLKTHDLKEMSNMYFSYA